MTKTKKKAFIWNVLIWDFNKDCLENYNVVPYFLDILKSMKKNKRPKDIDEFSVWLRNEAMYMFMARCEWEMIIHRWPKLKKDRKIDVYDQLSMNWNTFVECFWNNAAEKLCV